MPAPLLLFDLDDTLIDSSRIYEAALRAADIDPHSEEFLSARSRAKKNLPSGSPQSHQRLLYFKEMAAARGNWSAGQVLEQTRRYEQALAAGVRRRWTELGRARLLDGWRGRYRMGIITNETTRTQLLKLEAMDPDGSLFEHLVTSEECGHEKPSRVIFERALAAFGVNAVDCVMIGDSLECDCLPAVELGMRAVLSREFLNPSKQRSAPPEVATIDALPELSQFLS